MRGKGTSSKQIHHKLCIWTDFTTVNSPWAQDAAVHQNMRNKETRETPASCRMKNHQVWMLRQTHKELRNDLPDLLFHPASKHKQSTLMLRGVVSLRSSGEIQLSHCTCKSAFGYYDSISHWYSVFMVSASRMRID